MIRKLLFTAAAAYLGKKIMDSQKRQSASSRGDSANAMNKANASGTSTSSADIAGQAVDLMAGRHPGPEDRAPEAFRPDPTAPVSAEDRESMRPATIPVELRNE